MITRHRRSTHAVTLAVLSLSTLVACGRIKDSSASSASTETDLYSVALTASTPATLPKCTSALGGTTALVLSPPGLFSCLAGVWVPIPCVAIGAGAVAYASASQTLLACVAGTWTQVALPQGAMGPAGPMGTMGTPGLAGPAGPASLVDVELEQPGPNCATGGQRITVGIDGDGDGALKDGEITKTAYVCNGVPSAAEPDAGAGAPAADAGGSSDDASAPDAGPPSDASPPVGSFRITHMWLRDPHVYANALGCIDVTDTSVAGVSSFNGYLNRFLATDLSPLDGFLDLSPMLVFHPADPSAGTTPVDFFFNVACIAPVTGTTCTADTSLVPVGLSSTSQGSGTCLGVIPGTTTGYSPPVVSTTGPCFVTAPQSLPLLIFDVPLTLLDASIGATYEGSELANGLIRGFLRQTDAAATIVNVPGIGRVPVSSVLGGPGACGGTADLDTRNGENGWWLYFNFSASAVPFSDG
jgi:hypothetical protein